MHTTPTEQEQNDNRVFLTVLRNVHDSSKTIDGPTLCYLQGIKKFTWIVALITKHGYPLYINIITRVYRLR